MPYTDAEIVGFLHAYLPGRATDGGPAYRGPAQIQAALAFNPPLLHGVVLAPSGEPVADPKESGAGSFEAAKERLLAAPARRRQAARHGRRARATR